MLLGYFGQSSTELKGVSMADMAMRSVGRPSRGIAPRSALRARRKAGGWALPGAAKHRSVFRLLHAKRSREVFSLHPCTVMSPCQTLLGVCQTNGPFSP